MKAGFVLEAEGFFNRNPLDNKRYDVGVWRLPPSLDQLESEEEKAPYRAIGESDRMTLVFVKPAG
jgi:predicted methyltransferase